MSVFREKQIEVFSPTVAEQLMLDALSPRYLKLKHAPEDFPSMLASFCRAQWLYSYEIISVLDDINWNCSYYDDKEYAVRKTWNDYVNKKQDLLDALAFFEETFGGITFIRNLDL